MTEHVSGAQDPEVERVRAHTELVLADRGLIFLSTDPGLVDPRVTHAQLGRNSYKYSLTVQEGLVDEGFTAHLVQSASAQRFTERPTHYYGLVPHEQDTELDIVFDPTLGQFFRHHNHTYVGRRSNLRDLVLNRTDPYRLRFGIKHTEAFFEEKWGTKSTVVARRSFQ